MLCGFKVLALRASFERVCGVVLKALDAQLLESLRAMDSSDSEQGGPTQLQCDNRAERKRAQQLDEQSRRKRAMTERAARNPAGREFERNMAAVTSMGLTPLRVIRWIGEGYVGSPSLPQLLLEAFASGLVLQARIVDFWSPWLTGYTSIHSIVA